MHSKKSLAVLGLTLVILTFCWPGHREPEITGQITEPQQDKTDQQEVAKIFRRPPFEKVLKRPGLQMKFTALINADGVMRKFKGELVDQNDEPIELFDPQGILKAAINSENTVFEIKYRWNRCQQMTDPAKRQEETRRVANATTSYVILGELSEAGFYQLDPELRELVKQRLPKQRPKSKDSQNRATTASLGPGGFFINKLTNQK